MLETRFLLVVVLGFGVLGIFYFAYVVEHVLEYLIENHLKLCLLFDSFLLGLLRVRIKRIEHFLLLFIISKLFPRIRCSIHIDPLKRIRLFLDITCANRGTGHLFIGELADPRGNFGLHFGHYVMDVIC